MAAAVEKIVLENAVHVANVSYNVIEHNLREFLGYAASFSF
jgi:hypothetical protein